MVSRPVASSGAVLYFGDPRGALELLKRGVELCGIVHGRRGGEGYRSLLKAIDERYGLKRFPRWQKPDLSDPELISALRSLRPALLISGFYPRVIPPEVLAIAPGYNVHPSDLPKWRGPDPAYWVIASGEPETAICIHQLSEELDEGAIAARYPVKVRARESGVALARRLERRSAELLGAWVAELFQRAARARCLVTELELKLEPQRGEPSWAPLVAPDELEIDWELSALEVERLVRAASPYPGAYSALDTGFSPELLVIYSGRAHSDERLESLPIGAPVLIKGECYIKCGSGAYQLGRIKVGRREMSGAELARLLS